MVKAFWDEDVTEVPSETGSWGTPSSVLWFLGGPRTGNKGQGKAFSLITGDAVSVNLYFISDHFSHCCKENFAKFVQASQAAFFALEIGVPVTQ